MKNNPRDEAFQRKKAIFDRMSSRRQKYILKKGFEKWDPFIEPKDPIDIRKDKTKRTAQTLIREFLQTRGPKGYSDAYSRGIHELAIGIINDDERYNAMFEFSCWYKELLDKETGD